MSITQGLRRAMQIRGSGIATICGERRRTWTEFGHRVARLAGALGDLDLGAAGRVAILSLNSDRYLEYLYAVPWAGGVLVPLNVRLAPAEILQILQDSGAEILVVDDACGALLPALRSEPTAVRRIVFAGDGIPPEGSCHHEEILAAAAPADGAWQAGDDLAGIFYTGGTTGRPKGVMLSHGNILANALNVISLLHVTDGTVYLHAAPMFHLAGLGLAFATTLAGGTHTFIPRFDPADALRAIQEDRVTHGVFVPTMLNMMVQRPDVQAYDLSSLRAVIYGASPISESLLARVMETFSACELAQCYGMTELSPVATCLEFRHHKLEGPWKDKLRSAGRAAPSAEVRIVDPQDGEVARGTVGEIVARGPMVMKGYWNQPEATAQALRNGWMHTGDLGYMDEDGFVYVVDRLKDMIITGGENVYSAEIENVICQHAAVSMCAVIGIPSPEWGEAVHAVVVPKEGFTLDQESLLAHCRERVAGYKCPRSVEIRQQPLPLSAAGKVLKEELRRPFWEGRARQVT
jgi:acyl-CoA synthetase (AMP-forming)/AMP-acid ligase II